MACLACRHSYRALPQATTLEKLRDNLARLWRELFHLLRILLLAVDKCKIRTMIPEIERQRDILKEWVNIRGIKVVLWDLDDTLLDTVRVFIDQMELYTDYVHSRLPGFSREQVYRLLKESSNNAYHTFSVNPIRWKAVAGMMADSLPLDEEVFLDGLPIMMEVYETVPEFLDGAEDALRTFRGIGLPMGLVTHANEEWTQRKIRERGLEPFFDQIMIVPEDEFKGSGDWLEMIERFSVNPEDVLVLGDNLVGDIRAAHSIGVRHIVYFPGEWFIYNTDEIPEGVISVAGGVKNLESILALMG